MTATPRQTFALYCATGYDVRACSLTKEQASFLIGLSKSDKETAIKQVALLPGAVQKKQASNTPAMDYSAIWDEAYQAGIKAGQDCKPIGMRVMEHANPLDDNSPVVQSWDIPDGVCGFAWIVVRPGNCGFAKWAKKNKDARPEYGGGTCVYWVGEFNQSMQRKEAFANAFAEVLNKYGINASPRSRMD